MSSGSNKRFVFGTYRPVGACMLAVICLASTCENQDYLLPAPLTLTNAAPMKPVAVDLTQPYRGLNSVDYSVTNTGSESATFGLFAAVFCAPDECSEKSTSRIIGPVDPGSSDLGRLYESELGLGEFMHLEFQCFAEDESAEGACSGTLDYVVILRQTDCQGNNDCASDEYCDQNLGYCRFSEDAATGCQVGQRGDATSAVFAALLIGLITLCSITRKPPVRR